MINVQVVKQCIVLIPGGFGHGQVSEENVSPTAEVLQNIKSQPYVSRPSNEISIL